MPVVRRFVALGALLTPILAPALGGSSDAVRQASNTTRAVVIPTAVASQPMDEPTELWSPGHGPHTGFQPSGSPRELLLSFDDGPDLRGTPLILDELDRRGLKAIFFVTGWRLLGQRPEDVARRDLVRKIAAHGHLVANHSMNHHDLCQNPDKQAAEIDANSELIASTTGVRPLLFRSPYGAYCQSLAAALTARGMPDIGWNIDPQDWKRKDDEEAVLAYLIGKVDKLRGRGIMLLHDTHDASVHALPRFLDWLARENTRAVRQRRPPVNIIDYSVMVPKRPVTVSGVPELVRALYADAAGSMARYIP
jgi:peptidoglycan/xylan/chitin deacetylase (PgdA/CDA1 family)